MRTGSSLFILLLGGAEATSGKMTMWSLKENVIVGSNIAHEGGPSSCQFADPRNGGLESPAATSPYISSRMYCAADIHTLYDNGKACGRCYKISFAGSGGTDGGRAGSTVIQVVNSGHMNHGAAFDCQVDAFQAITGAQTGVYPITYEEVACEQTEGGGVATVLAGDNAYYTKLVFSNLVRPATRVTMIAGSKSYDLELQQCCGTWAGQLGGDQGHVDFELKHQDGSRTKFNGCFTGWPVKTSTACGLNGEAVEGGMEPPGGGGSPVPSPPGGGGSPVPSPPATADKTCSPKWGHDCRQTKCCMDAGFTCFKKNDHWASCRQSCTEGETDNHDHHKWLCEDLSGKADSAALLAMARDLAPTTSYSPYLCAGLAALAVMAAAVSLKRRWRSMPSALNPSLLVPEE